MNLDFKKLLSDMNILLEVHLNNLVKFLLIKNNSTKPDCISPFQNKVVRGHVRC